MSPGINDPGTAINAIDYLTDLFLLRMNKKDTSYYLNEGQPVINIKTLSFSELLYNVMAALRTYCKHDITMVTKLFIMLRHLLHSDEKYIDSYRDSIIHEINNLHEDAIKNISNKTDLNRMELLYNDLINT